MEVVTTAQPTQQNASKGPGVQQPNKVVPIIMQPKTTNIVLNTEHRAEREWTSGMCACCDDVGSCFLAAFCPCCLIFMLAQDMGDDCCSACCYALYNPVGTFGLRVYLRGKENIRGRLYDDFKVTIGPYSCLSCCALAQVAREVKLIKSIRGTV